MKTPILLTSILFFSSRTVSFAHFGQSTNPPDSILSALLGFLPVAVFLVVLFYMFRRETKPLIDHRQKKVERKIQHMQRVEELLERIAVALERK
ncbi:MAG: hypothetical protein M3463_04900 [Verrucomicrobiota bacterium]|nr:hypothetical protein [Verrucomicrobiota bacterium]